MIEPDESICQAAYAYREFTPINITQYVQIGLGVSSLATMWKLIKTDELQRLWGVVTPNLKIIAAVGISLYIMGAAFSLSFYVYVTVSSLQSLRVFQILNFLDLSACAYVWTTFDCWLFRLPMYYCVVGFNCFHVSLLIDRVFATFLPVVCGHSNGRLVSGVLLGIATVLTPLLVTLWIFGNEDLEKLRTYCLAGSVSASDRIMLCTKAMTVVDLAAMTGDFLLMVHNRRRMRRVAHEYNLQRQFGMREIEITIRFIFPFAVIHSVAFLIYLSFFSLNRAYLTGLDEQQMYFFAEINSCSKALYIALVPATTLAVRRRQRPETAQWLREQSARVGDLYFEMFRKQIS